MIRLQQTCIVGVGNLGRQTLEHFKRRLVKTYQELPSIKLLAIDIVAPAGGMPLSRTAESEASALGPDEIIEWVFPSQSLDALRETYPWIPDELSVENGDWTQTRAGARVALHTNLSDWYQTLRSHIAALGDVDSISLMNTKGFEISSSDQNINEANFILVASVDDIVGSGIGVDLAFLFHRLYEDLGFQTASTGILFLPPTNRANPEAEARAYAALKELNGLMDPGSDERRPPYRCEYDQPRLTIETKAPPFNRGVYLLDSRNERALTLRDSAELAKLTGEWLFRVILSPLNARVSSFVAQGGVPRIQGQPAEYASFGLAAYTLPIDGLIDHCSDRFGRELLAENLLRPERFDSASSQFEKFMSDARLRPDDLIEQTLLRDDSKKPIKTPSRKFTSLEMAGNSEFAALFAAVSGQLQQQLQDHRKQIDKNASKAVPDIGAKLDGEIAQILKNEAASGQLSLATQFAGRVRDEAERSASAMLRKSAVFRSLSNKHGRELKSIMPSLKRSIESMPELGALAALVIGGLFAPLAIFGTWLWNGLTAWTEPARAITIAILWIVSGLATAYTLRYTADGVKKLRNRAITLLDRRFNTELRQAAYEQASKLYPELAIEGTTALGKLGALAEALHATARTFRTRQRPEALCGTVDFALQRSVLTLDTIEALYAEGLGPTGAAGRVSDLVAKHGTLERWLNYGSEEIERRVKEFGMTLFESLRGQKLETLLQKDMSTPAGAEKRVRELLDNSAPLWSYSQTVLGHGAAPPDQVLVGLDQTDKSLLRERFGVVNPTTQFGSTGDKHSLVVTTLRRGLPLFALIRMSEMRRNYLEAVRTKSMPLHVEDALALSPDLEKTAFSSGERYDAGTQFAVAFCLGIIRKPEGSANYVAVDANGRPLGFPLASDKIESAIFLGIPENQDLLRKVADRVRSITEERGVAAVSSELLKYADRADTADWEHNRILAHVAATQG